MSGEMCPAMCAEEILHGHGWLAAVNALARADAQLGGSAFRLHAHGNNRCAQLTTCFSSPLAYFSAIFDRLIALIFEPWPAQLNSW